MYSHKGESPDSEVALESVFLNFRILEILLLLFFGGFFGSFFVVVLFVFAKPWNLEEKR